MTYQSPGAAPNEPPFGSAVHRPVPSWPLPPPEAVTPSERSAAMWAHLGVLIGALVGLLTSVALVPVGLLLWIIPLVIRSTAGERSSFVRWNATQSLNFELTSLLVLAASLVLSIILVGLLTALLWGVFYVVVRSIASSRANRGVAYTYPLTIRFVK